MNTNFWLLMLLITSCHACSCASLKITACSRSHYFLGKLLEAATFFGDMKILAPLQSTDCVAAEVCYHPSCRSDYLYRYGQHIKKQEAHQ